MSAVAAPPASLRAEDVTVELGGRRLLDGVSVELAPGESVAITGPSGAGKTTLLTVLAGLVTPARGRVRLGALDITGGPPAAVRRRFGIAHQGYGLLSLLTAAENVEIALQAAGRPRAEVRETAARALDAVGLAGRADHLAEELSGGEQQRVAIARALAPRPEIVMADEPTAELDSENRGRIVDLLLNVAAAHRILLLVTHDPEVAERCGRRLVLGGGRLTEAA